MESFFHMNKDNKISRLIFEPLDKYNSALLDKIIIAYVAVVLLFQELFLIAPAMSYIATTPLYSIQTYLGILGAALIVADMLTNKGLWKAPSMRLLFGICFFAAVASVRMSEYGGLRQNLFMVCWSVILFALIYSLAFRMDNDNMGKWIKYLYALLLSIWVVACLVSIYQYVCQIEYEYVINPLAQDISTSRQGFFDNRLFGIFNTLNHSAFVSLYFFFIGIMYIIRSKKLAVKLTLGVANAILLAHIVLSVSRSAMIALLACFVCLFCALLKNKMTYRGSFRVVLIILLAILLTASCFVVIKGYTAALEQIPGLYCVMQGDEFFEIDLDRKGLGGDSSNGRLSIWADYLSIWKDVGVIGLSPANYMNYVRGNYPELYVVDYIRENYPDKYESGVIYHVHSGYLMVYVSAGIFGAMFMIAFMAVCIGKFIKCMNISESVTDLFTGALLIVVAGAVAAVFDIGLIFQNNPHTSLFWVALGILMKESLNKIR